LADVTLEEIARRLKVAIGPLPNKLARGGIIGIAEIVDCVAAHTSRWFEGPVRLRAARRPQAVLLPDARATNARPYGLSIRRAIHALDRAIQKVSDMLQADVQFRRYILVNIIRNPQSLRHQAPRLMQFRHSASPYYFRLY